MILLILNLVKGQSEAGLQKRKGEGKIFEWENGRMGELERNKFNHGLHGVHGECTDLNFRVNP